VLETGNQPHDGVLAVTRLNLKAVNIDFEGDLVSWRR
jgi:hypothetical protein